jgi:hypothetical protein
MPRPGTDVIISDVAIPGGPSLNTGQAFIVGQTEKGPTDVYTKVSSLKQYATVYGTRAGGQAMSDGVSAYFQEGGGVAYIASTGTVAPVAATVEAALDLFTYELGPGQVCAPGLSAVDEQTAVLAHVDATHRCALLDLAPGDAAELDAAVSALYALPGVRFAAALAPAISYPIADVGTVVDVPFSTIQAGLIAKSDLRGNPNTAAAGVNGVHRMSVALATDYTDDERETLNEAGVTLAKLVYGDVRTYGARTAAGADDTTWLWFPNSRVVMTVAHRADAIAQNYLFRQIDGRRKLFAAMEAELAAMLLDLYMIGALYGDSPADAFSVDTGPQVNTIDTIANGEVHAVIRLKTSPSAEWVVVEVVKLPLQVPIAA